MKKAVFTVIMLLAMVVFAFGAGFNIYEFGARSSAMGGATVARAWDASTIFFNPAGLAFLDGGQFYGGVTLIVPSAKFVGAAPIFDSRVHSAKDQVFPPPGIYLSYKLGSRFAAGVGFTTPFSLGLEWKDDFPGRGVSRDVDLKSFYIHAVGAYELLPNLSIGGGLDFVKSTVNLKRNVFLFNSPGSPGYEVGTAELDGTSDWKVGFSAALQYRADRFGFGVMYRHRINNEFNNGDATFQIFDNLSVPNVAAVASSILKNQKVSTAITYPNYVTLGVYLGLTEKLGLESDVNVFNWSVFDRVRLDFEDDKLDAVLNENYHDSFTARLGVHYNLTDQFTLLGGYIYDTTPQPIESVSPLLPDDTRHDFSVGFSYSAGLLKVDAGYMFVSIGDRSTVENGIGRSDVGFNGTYNSHAHLFFSSVGISF
ncbi:MAG: hypothetical protein D6715_02240 [Calditrichaeota bacterium]|nr:MAG: hypothetical protein D6715_02240 [Calditrichota bacterium]